MNCLGEMLATAVRFHVSCHEVNPNDSELVPKSLMTGWTSLENSKQNLVHIISTVKFKSDLFNNKKINA